MAQMSNKYMCMSKGYARVKTNFGLEINAYCEVWSAFSCDSANLKVKITAPKGYRVVDVQCELSYAEVRGSFLEIPCCIARDWNIDQHVQQVCDKIVFRVERIVDSALGAVLISDRLGIVSARVGRFVSYQEVVDAVNEYAMDPVFSHETISGYICTADEAEEALTLMCQEDTEFDIIDVKSAPLCVKAMTKWQ